MADRSKIEWTDATWNPIIGCSVLSPGCKHCYAMRLAGTRLKNAPSRQGLTIETKAGPVWNGQVRFMEQWLTQPLHWAKPREIFVGAHSDLFYDGVTDEQLDQIFAVMALGRWHRFQVLTKRPDRMLAYLADRETQRRVYHAMQRIVAEPIGGRHVNNLRVTTCFPWAWPLPHVIVGASIERQQEADERRPALRFLASQGWATWVSYEPALGPVDWTGWNFIGWLVAGGESGPNARPSHPDWHRAARDYCQPRGIPFFFKQWGNWAPIAEWGDGLSPDKSRREVAISCSGSDVPDDENPDDVRGQRLAFVTKQAAGALLDGESWKQFPEWADA